MTILARLLAAKERAADPTTRIDCSDMTNDEFLARLTQPVIQYNDMTDAQKRIVDAGNGPI